MKTDPILFSGHLLQSLSRTELEGDVSTRIKPRLNLKPYSQTGDNIMYKILATATATATATALILALTACYPVYAEKYTVDDSIKIITQGKILASNLNYSPSDSWNAPEERHFNLLVLYNKKLFICFVMDTKDFIVPDCKGTV